MGTMNANIAGAMPQQSGAPMNDNDGDGDQLITCPSCGAQFSPQDTDNDAAQLQAGAGSGAPGGPGAGTPTDMATAAPPPITSAPSGDTCPECGGQMSGGKCASCGYSEGHSPMQDKIAQHIGGQPEHARSDAKTVYEKGLKARQHMRRPAPYGRP